MNGRMEAVGEEDCSHSLTYRIDVILDFRNVGVDNSGTFLCYIADVIASAQQLRWNENARRCADGKNISVAKLPKSMKQQCSIVLKRSTVAEANFPHVNVMK